VATAVAATATASPRWPALGVPARPNSVAPPTPTASSRSAKMSSAPLPASGTPFYPTIQSSPRRPIGGLARRFSEVPRGLVTGHNAYIGSVLVPVVEHAGHEVIELDSDLFALAHLARTETTWRRCTPILPTLRARTSLASMRRTTRTRDLAEIVARVLPEFESSLTARRGVEELHEAHARNGLTFEEFTSTSYLRINRVRELPEAGRLDDNVRWRLPMEVA
jgi:hypothetical protein